MVASRLLGLGAAFVAILTLLAHAPALRHDFVWWDDPTHVTQNPYIRELTLPNLVAIFTQPIAKLYCPLTWLSFALDHEIWGRNPIGYHLTNLLLHSANALWIFLITHRLLHPAPNPQLPSAPGYPGATHTGQIQFILPAFVTATLFGIHPLRVESVAWVTERKDVLFVLFYLLGLLAFLQRKPLPLVFALFVASALSKPTAVTFPLVLWLLSRWDHRHLPATALAPFLAVSFLIGIVTIGAQITGTGDTVARGDTIPWHIRPALVAYCALFYPGKFFWPFNLSAIYPTYDEMNWQPVAYLTGFVALNVFLWAVRRHEPWVWRGWLLYLTTLLPTIGILPVGIHVVADRYAYLAVWGLSIAVAAVAARFRIVMLTLLLCLPALFYLTTLRTAVWRNTETLFLSVLDDYPSNLPALINLTKWYTAHGDLETAIELGQRAVTVAPASEFARRNLAIALYRAGRTNDALTVWPPLATEPSPNATR